MAQNVQMKNKMEFSETGTDVSLVIAGNIPHTVFGTEMAVRRETLIFFSQWTLNNLILLSKNVSIC